MLNTILIQLCIDITGVLVAPHYDSEGCDITAYEPQYHTLDWIALVERGRCEFRDKAVSALHHGAKAIVVFMDSDEDPNTLMANIPGREE